MFMLKLLMIVLKVEMMILDVIVFVYYNIIKGILVYYFESCM